MAARVELWQGEADIPRFLADVDFARHNEEQAAAWRAFHERRPYRVPIYVSTATRYFMFSREFDAGVDFETYSNDPEIMMRAQLRWNAWKAFNVMQDAPLGLPEKWSVGVDLQNYYEAGWLGCPVVYDRDQVPDTRPILTDDRKNLLFDRGLPEPLGGLMAKNVAFYEWMKARRDADLTFLGRPIGNIGMSGMSTDGPFTAAANLRGATEICLDLLTDPDYAHRLLGFITDATIARIRALRHVAGKPPRPERYDIADDSVALLSTATYREFVLPCHKRLFAELAGAGPHGIHLCGDATHLFPTIRDELNVNRFDTGFPVDFAQLRKDLGPDIQVSGGPHAALIQQGPISAIESRTREILRSGIADNAPFALREGNNLAPFTPLAHIRRFYEAGRRDGVYDADGSIRRGE